MMHSPGAGIRIQVGLESISPIHQVDPQEPDLQKWQRHAVQPNSML
jgi:hypothetical protein